MVSRYEIYLRGWQHAYRHGICSPEQLKVNGVFFSVIDILLIATEEPIA